jgi:hypothetical protein
VLKITDNIIPANKRNTTFGIAANGTRDEVLLADISFTDSTLLNSDIFDTLFLSAEF